MGLMALSLMTVIMCIFKNVCLGAAQQRNPLLSSRLQPFRLLQFFLLTQRMSWLITVTHTTLRVSKPVICPRWTLQWGNSCLSLKSPSVPWPLLVTPPRCDCDVLPEPQQQPRQPPADGYIQPGYCAQELAVKEMEEAISPREALALLNTGWQSVFPRAWQSSSQHFPPKRLHPSVRCNRRNERSDFSPDRVS